jgi:hypothetical protein
MRRVRQDHRELELSLGASISVHRLSSYGIRMTAIPNASGFQPAGKIDLLTAHLRTHPGLTGGLPRVGAGHLLRGATNGGGHLLLIRRHHSALQLG